MLAFIEQYALWIGIGILSAIIWEVVWKGVGAWHAARNNQPVWFWCIVVFNTLGILSIAYVLFFSEKN